MSYAATVVKVMIASPGDVANERQLIRDVLHEWNAVNSEKASIVLMPVGWETHSSPAMGAPAQEIINRQVLEGCDLLIATFWTRLGSPTGQSPSGTVEEIWKHLGAGKPTMIYFSSAPVHLDSIDKEQYEALKEFRENCRQQGLVEAYDSLSEFRQKFARQLAQTVIRCFADEGIQHDATTVSPQEAALPSLSDSAKELLLAAAQDDHGVLMCIQTFDGYHVQASGRQFGEPRDPRSKALMEKAIKDLCSLGLLEPRGHKGEVFGVTQEGYEVADRLRQQG